MLHIHDISKFQAAARNTILSASPGANRNQQFTVWAEDVGKKVRQDAAKHQVGICDGCIAPFPVAHRPWVGSC